MPDTFSSVKFGLMGLLVFAVGCSHAAKETSAAQPAATAAQTAPGTATKPTVKETQTTVTVHTDSKKGDKKKAEKATAAKPAATGEAPTGGFLCTSGGDERKLALKATPSGGCEVLYTKAGNTTSIAHADHETSYCEKALEKTKANLEKAGYNCTK